MPSNEEMSSEGSWQGAVRAQLNNACGAASLALGGHIAPVRGDGAQMKPDFELDN